MNCPSGHPMRMIGGGNIAASGKKTPLYLISERRRLIEAAILDVKIDGRISGQTMGMAATLRKKKQ